VKCVFCEHKQMLKIQMLNTNVKSQKKLFCEHANTPTQMLKLQIKFTFKFKFHAEHMQIEIKRFKNDINLDSMHAHHA
jgi:hypothetical protein